MTAKSSAFSRHFLSIKRSRHFEVASAYICSCIQEYSIQKLFNLEFIAKTFHGLEPVLAQELQDLGLHDIELLNRAVAFSGDLAGLYKANVQLRTALRILRPIHQFEAFNEDRLYKAVYEYDWEPWLKLNQTFAIDTTLFSRHFRHSKYVALKTKDAIVDQFRKRYGRRPSIDTRNPDIRLQLHVHDKRFTVSLDSSGEPLFKRGYRGRSHPAPLNEVLAAGMIKLSGWTPDQIFADPMCGSGTLLIEAALMARNVPPALAMSRRQFAFENWQDFDKARWMQVQEEAKAGITDTPFQIFGSDIEQRSIDVCLESLYKLRLKKDIQLRRGDFRKAEAPAEAGILISNPPYGERIGPGDILQFYQQIGDALKTNWTGWNAWLLSSNKDALKRIGLRPSTKKTLFNGPLECKFQQFELYQGSKKEKAKTT